MDSAFYDNVQLRLAGSAAEAELSGTAGSAEACGGPWSPELQHGGPPSALLVLAAERLAARAAGRSDLLAVRLAAEFLAPVPVAGLVLAARVSRLSRSAVLVSAELGTAQRTSLQARIWLLAPGEPARPAEPAPAQLTDPARLPSFGFETFPYARHLDWRLVTGSAFEPGPATVWVRPRVPLILGEPLSGLQRAALLADSASGISAELDWAEWSFANVDLDLHLLRPLLGDWLLLQAATRLGAGVAMTSCDLADLAGPVGAGLQTLLVRRSA